MASSKLGASNEQQTLINVSSATYVADGNSGALDATGLRSLMAVVVTGTFVGGTTTHVTLEQQGPDNNWVGVQSMAISPNGTYAMYAGYDVPSGLTMFSDTVRLNWDITSEGLTSATFSYYVLGQS